MDIIKAALLPHLLEIIGILLASLIGWAANTARRKWGIDIEARHREALQSALLNGARLALERGFGGQAAVAEILKHVQISVPDAVIGLDARAEVLGNLAQAKLREVAQGAGGVQKLEVALKELNARRG